MSKKKVLFIANHRKNRSPGQRFRFEQYISYLENNGFECHLSFLLNERDDKIFYSQGKYLQKGGIFLKCLIIRFGDLLNCNRYEIIFIFREALIVGTSFFEKIFSKSRAKLIFDFDDAIWLNQISKHSAPNKSLNFLKRPEKTDDIIQACDMVFAGNEYLAEHAEKFCSNVKIVPTTIDTNYHKPDFSRRGIDNRICIGWTGSTTTIDHFFEALPALQWLQNHYENLLHFKIIGKKHVNAPGLDVISMDWSPSIEISELNTFDIGIMPLPDDEWARGKCGFKGLQYMSCSIPSVLARVGVNKKIIKHGENGYLAFNQDEWINCLRILVDDINLRRVIGQAGRQTVEEMYSVNIWETRYLRFFNELLT